MDVRAFPELVYLACTCTVLGLLRCRTYLERLAERNRDLAGRIRRRK